ncbi:oxidoreductase [Capsaspora owczarzaki ATCC 30864]|uniref:Oxidoreductase n=1 Tax=Capsaspora owczarzaki (strain ATCC 30864) TaxID=595528 RepID=A0A0D2X4G2_CAPO3|nr:oxidoreductase [Capsaspora owczarzaki ATCC 30864]KJE96004.1 oxidoreductase [Capsaspora owczarzaki ATCC 30864]|eukprot:XP_004345128.1 oxidoreductase [Capsaspora owczarzaki ATCC 30864]
MSEAFKPVIPTTTNEGKSIGRFGYRTPAEEVVTELGIDLSDRVAIITGASSGLGKEAARVLALKGAHIIIAIRNLEAGQKVAQEIQQSTGNTKIEAMLVDLTSLKSIKEFADAFIAKKLPLNLLINNAGVMALPTRETTADGFEMQFGTNHIGHFYLTQLLTPALIAAAPSRVVVLSSMGHAFSPIMFDDVNWEKSYDAWRAYGQSKTANALFALELNKRLSPKGVIAVSLHPGGAMTNLGRHISREYMIANGWMNEDGTLHSIFKTVEQCSSTTVYCAIAPEVLEHGGAYFEDCNLSVPSPHASDPEAAAKLWEVSEKLISDALKQ